MKAMRRRSFIGIDVGGRAIRAVQLGPARGDRPVVEAAAAVPRILPASADLEAEAARLAQVLERHAFVGNDIVLCAPDDRLISATVDVPPRTSGAPVEQIAKAELARIHRLDEDALEMACWDLPAPPRSTGAAVLAAACPRDAAERFIGAFEAAGLRVRGLDLRVLALARTLRYAEERVPDPSAGIAQPPVSSLRAVLDLGWSKGVLGVMRGETVVFERLLQDAGTSGLHASLVERLGLAAEITHYVLDRVGLESPAGPLEKSELLHEAQRTLGQYADGAAEQVSVSFTYITHRYQEPVIPRLALVGEAAEIPGLAARLASRLDADVRALCPSDAADLAGPGTAAATRPSLAAALGLALYPQELAA